MKKNKEQSEIENIEEDTKEDITSQKSFESNIDTSFFYTSDKFINSIDDNEIIQFIQSKYKKINSNSDDSVLKKNIGYFLDDDNFVDNVLSYYNINIFDVFKLLFKQFGTIFKGPYLKKLKKITANKKYAKFRRQ